MSMQSFESVSVRESIKAQRERAKATAAQYTEAAQRYEAEIAKIDRVVRAVTTIEESANDLVVYTLRAPENRVSELYHALMEEIERTIKAMYEQVEGEQIDHAADFLREYVKDEEATECKQT